MTDQMLIEKLKGREDLPEQLRAMASVSLSARRMHRFDEYLIAAANELDELRAALRSSREG